MSALDFGAGAGTNTTRYYSIASGPGASGACTVLAWWRNNATRSANSSSYLMSWGSDPTSAEGGSVEIYDTEQGTSGTYRLQSVLWVRFKGASAQSWAATPSQADINSGIGPLVNDGKDYLVGWVCTGTASTTKAYLIEEGTSATAYTPQAVGSLNGGNGITSALAWNVGRRVYSPNGYFVTTPLGECWVFDSALSESQLTSLAAGIPPESIATPIIRWKFRDGDVTTESNAGSGGTFDLTKNGTGYTTTTEFWADTPPVITPSIPIIRSVVMR